MKSRYLNAKVSGIVAALFTFLLAHLILGKDGDGNLIVFGVPAIAGGLTVFYTMRFINRLPLRTKKK
jgi:Na+/citrate or Na+/malate symporter